VAFFSWRCFVVVAAIGLQLATTSAQEPELVNVRAVDPTIVVELRYATSNNIVGRPIYPRDMPALLRPSVAERLAKANAELKPYGFRIKVWDAYRPKAAHDQLWQFAPQSDFVADPKAGGSLHTWGVAVDATLVDRKGRYVRMPTDFDEFTPAAMLRYQGSNPNVRRHLRLLQMAMSRGGFYGMRTEWWHFVAKNWQDYKPVNDGGRFALPQPAQPVVPRNGVRTR
jgi:zinc D-Ala-D-Ala dipeptidase